MEKIVKKIKINDFKSHFFGKLPSVSEKYGDNVSIEDGSENMAHFGYVYGYDSYTDYGKYPYSVKFDKNCKISGGDDETNAILMYHSKLCEISNQFCNDNVLPYKSMVSLYGKLRRIFNEGDYYLIHNDGIDICFVPTKKVQYDSNRLLLAHDLPKEVCVVKNDKYGLDDTYPYPMEFVFYEYDGGVSETLEDVPFEYVYTDGNCNVIRTDKKPEGVYYEEVRKPYEVVTLRFDDMAYPKEVFDTYMDGYILCVHDLVSDVLPMFSDRGVEYGGRYRYEVDFMKFCEGLYRHIVKLNDGEFSKLFDMPYIPFTLHIEQSFNGLGGYRPYYLDWSPNTTYYKGSVVLHDGEYYFLNDLPEYAGTVPPTDDDNWVKMFYKSYHDGFVTGYVKSKIHEYENKRPFDIDDDGNELPFYVSENGKVHTRFMIHDSLVGYGKDKATVIYKVFLSKDVRGDEGLVEIDYSKCTEKGYFCYHSMMDEYQYIKFHYCRDASVIDGAIDLNTGFHYMDTFYFERKVYEDFEFGGRKYRGVTYLDIDFGVSNYVDFEHELPMAEIRFRPTNLLMEDSAPGLLVYHNEGDMCIDDLTVNSRVVIERSEDSKANSYWRHMKLGEMQSVKQMERNNFF